MVVSDQDGVAIGVGVVSAALISAFVYKNYVKKIKTALEINTSLYNKKIKGIVVNVADGDNFRLYHIPRLRPSWAVSRDINRLKSIKNYLKYQGKTS
ncbi:putative endonuclease LCL3 [Smittium culicis]|uniref:Putative endonuclease LCL3 n=1 Tax=Smittium culicis TaxID=133412 RepID=A0A1R1X521_9FUNG|nr:putative endonuclease LCL3 [Smittium culicis]